MGGGGMGGGTGSRGGGAGSSTSQSTDSTELIDLLNATSSRWSAAVVGDQSAAGYILSSETAVMSIGGWRGSDPSPTLAQFQAYVKAGDITYFIASDSGMGGGGGRGGSDTTASQITSWVEANYTAKTVGGVTVYDLQASS